MEKVKNNKSIKKVNNKKNRSIKTRNVKTRNVKTSGKKLSNVRISNSIDEKKRSNIGAEKKEVRLNEAKFSNSINKTRVPKKKKVKIVNIIIVGLICLFMIIGLTMIFKGETKPKDDNLIYNKNKSFIKHQKIDGIAFKDINCTYDGKDSLITYTIINETKNNIYLSNYDVIIRDKNKQIITKIVANYSENILPNKKISMANSVIGVDLTNAYYMELKLKTGKN